MKLKAQRQSGRFGRTSSKNFKQGLNEYSEGLIQNKFGNQPYNLLQQSSFNQSQIVPRQRVNNGIQGYDNAHKTETMTRSPPTFINNAKVGASGSAASSGGWNENAYRNLQYPYQYDGDVNSVGTFNQNIPQYLRKV